MSFFTALMDAYGGYGQGKQQRFQDTIAQQQQQLAQQQQGTYQQQADIEGQKWKETQRQILQNRGINPDTNQPYVMPQNLTNATGGLPNKGHATLQQLVDWHMGRAHYYRQTGQTDAATDEINNALNLQGIQAQQTSSLATLQREMMMKQYDNLNPSPLTQAEISFYQAGRPTYANTWNEQHGLPPWYTGQNPALTDQSKISTQLHSQAAGLMAKYNADRKNAITTPTDPTTKMNIDAKTGAILQPLLGTQEQSDLDGVIGVLSQEQDPAKVMGLAKKYAVSPNKKFNSLVNEFAAGRVAQIKAYQAQSAIIKAYQQQQQQLQQGNYGGGSYGSSNPTVGGPHPKLGADAIWDMLVANGATPQEATTLAAVAMAESGGDPSQVNPTDNGGKQTSWGLFQISDGTHNEPSGWNDPETNVRMAIAKLRSRQGLGAWGTYTSGAYKRFLPAPVR